MQSPVRSPFPDTSTRPDDPYGTFTNDNASSDLSDGPLPPTPEQLARSFSAMGWPAMYRDDSFECDGSTSPYGFLEQDEMPSLPPVRLSFYAPPCEAGMSQQQCEEQKQRDVTALLCRVHQLQDEGRVAEALSEVSG